MVFTGLDELLGIEPSVNRDEKAIEINEVIEALGGELEQRGVSAVGLVGRASINS